jgi:hypothetical protein
VHDVGRADIHAMSAAIAARHINEGRHDVYYLMSRRSMRRRSVMLGIFDAPLSDERSIRLCGGARPFMPSIPVSTDD